MQTVKIMYLVSNYNGWGDPVVIRHKDIEVNKENNLIDIQRLVHNTMPEHHSFEYCGQRIINEKYLKLKGIIK